MEHEHKIKLLLVDDEKFLLDLYATHFLKEGFDVFVTSSAEEALAAIARGYIPDVILFDINMPEHSGYELLEQLDRVPALKHTKKVALTNEGQDGGIERTKELGVDAHLIKAQYTPSELAARVRTLVGRS